MRVAPVDGAISDVNTGEEQAIARQGGRSQIGRRLVSTMRDALLAHSRKILMADKRARVDDLRGSDFRRSATPVPADNGVASVRERLPLDRGLTVGRQAMPGQVVLDHPNVSRRHAAFEIMDGAIVLRDLGGTNGTCQRRAPARYGRLVHGDRINRPISTDI